MRVMLVNDFYAPYMIGGAETLVRNLAAGLQSQGHQIMIVTAGIQGLPRDGAYDTIPVRRIGRFPKINYTKAIASGTAPQPLTQVAKRDFQEAIAEFQPDVIHFHNIWLLGPEIVNVTTARKGVTLHDYWPICVRRTMIRINWQACDGPNPLACRLCRLRAPATIHSFNLVSIEREYKQHAQILHSCNFVTAPSQFLAKQIAHNSGCNPSVVYNGVAMTDNREERIEVRPYVLFGSRPVTNKGFDIARQAFARPELQSYTLHVAGDSTAVNDRNITILGHQPPHRMSTLIDQASCVIVPSIWPENCPMIILEALRAGVPVIASNIGGIPELVEHGVTGLLVPPGDAAALAAAIRRSCEDEQLRMTARTAGPTMVREHFSCDAMIRQFEELYVV